MQLTALIIFVITYVGIIFTRLPKINIDRPSAAFFGAVAMVVFGVLDLGEAMQAIDYNTIILLLGMMNFNPAVRRFLFPVSRENALLVKNSCPPAGHHHFCNRYCQCFPG